MDDLTLTLERVTEEIRRYRRGLGDSRVSPAATRAAVRTGLERPVPETGSPSDQVIAELIERATPGLMASAGPRYFGFVVGGSVDAALAADLLTSGWDQCAFNEALSPSALAFEEVRGNVGAAALAEIREVLSLILDFH
jgi:glutamate/tyrosine decarboxylase-like PLP-dependent enzyme